jgi:hypothetical protein
MLQIEKVSVSYLPNYTAMSLRTSHLFWNVSYSWVVKFLLIHFNYIFGLYLWVLHPVAHLSNWFLVIPSIATKFQYVNSFLFSFTHYMFRPLRAIFRWDIQWTISNITDPLHVRDPIQRCYLLYIGALTLYSQYMLSFGYKYKSCRHKIVKKTLNIKTLNIRNSPLKHLIVYLAWRWPVGAETCSEREGK